MIRQGATVSRRLLLRSRRRTIRRPLLQNLPPTPIRRSLSLASYIGQVFRTGSLNPTNPLLATAENQELVDFSNVQAHHLTKAATKVRQDYDARFEALLKDIETTSADELVKRLEELEEPVQNIMNVATLYRQMRCYDKSWLTAVAKTAESLSMLPHADSRVIFEAVERHLESSESLTTETMERLKLLDGQYKKRGAHLAPDSEEANQLAEVQMALQQYESKFIPFSGDQESGSTNTRERLEDMYAILALKSHAAKLLGFEHQVDLQLHGRAMMDSMKDIQQLHEEVAARARVIVNKTSMSDMQTVLGENNADNLSEYLTLDGTLGGLFALTRALFGVVVLEEEHAANAWYPDVRLFHVTDEAAKEHLGSFYLDAYQRPTKTREAFMGPLSKHVVFVNTSIVPPMWNDMPTQLRHADALDLFHEFGHVLQFLLSKHKGIVGPRNFPIDVSEVIPQFMEHWLFEESILQTLAHMSQADDPIPAESIVRLQQQRSTRKAFEMMQRVFLGQLELELFSSSRKDGDESLVGMQRRLAEQYLAHDLPGKSDLSPLSQVFEANAKGKHVAQYRYLLSEVMSADIFANFKQADIANQDEMKRLGSQLCESLLAPGALVDGKAAAQTMLGRNVTTDALFKMYRM